ncbi:MAG: DUF2934 domain-containing protein [Candidatus Sulfotelmatobacter sp.]|jgi:hypothetical protein
MTHTTAMTTTSRATNQATENTSELQEQIRRRAYELYEQRGRTDGHETDDWLQAELELTQWMPDKIAA